MGKREDRGSEAQEVRSLSLAGEIGERLPEIKHVRVF
jgi:hypothetical protein